MKLPVQPVTLPFEGRPVLQVLAPAFLHFQVSNCRSEDRLVAMHADLVGIQTTLDDLNQCQLRREQVGCHVE